MGKKGFKKAGAVHIQLAGFATAPSRSYAGTGATSTVQK
jgi:hypothetical protein